MATTFLYPTQRRIEVTSALYAGGLGVFIGVQHAVYDRNILHWLPISPAAQLAVGFTLIASAVIWALGVNINGRWFGSPFLRLAAMVINFAIAVFATGAAAGTTASYTYGWAAAFLAIGAFNAGSDCRKSLKGEQLWKLN